MPEGPLGASRPLASSSLNVEIEVNAPDGKVDEMLLEELTSRFRRVSEITISEEIEIVADQSFDKIVIQVLFNDSTVRLSVVEDVVTDIEEALGEERIGVTIESV